MTSRTALYGLTALNDARQVTIDVLADAEAKTLVAHIVGHGRVRTEPEAASELVKLCAHLPLALRITAVNPASRPHPEHHRLRGRGDVRKPFRRNGSRRRRGRGRAHRVRSVLQTSAKKVSNVDLTQAAAFVELIGGTFSAGNGNDLKDQARYGVEVQASVHNGIADEGRSAWTRAPGRT